jgi:hypothetical protein
MFQDLLMLAIISTQSSVRPYHRVCDLLNQGQALRRPFLTSNASALKPDVTTLPALEKWHATETPEFSDYS